MNTVQVEFTVAETDDYEDLDIKHGDDCKLDARRRLESRLDDLKLKREIEDLW